MHGRAVVRGDRSAIDGVPAEISVGLVVGSLTRTGAGMSKSVLSLARGLTARPGCAVTVYGLNDVYTGQDLADWEGIAAQSFATAGPRSFGYAHRLSAGLRKSGHDILHLHGLWMYPSIAVRRASRQAAIATVVSPHGMLYPWALRISAAKKRVAWLAYEGGNLRHARCLHALGHAELEAMRALDLKNPVAIIPNGVTVPSKPVTRRKRSSSEGGARRTLLYLGRIHPIKGLQDAIEAWAILCRQRPDLADEWLFTITGWNDGGHEESLRRLVAERGVERSVSFTGPQFGAAKEESLRTADAFILPSHSEGLPVAILEAWAYRLPVMMTGGCNLPVGFSANAAVEIVHEPSSLAAQMIEFLQLSDAERQRFGDNGRALVEKAFTWERVGVDFERLYQWVLGGGDCPDFVDAQ